MALQWRHDGECTHQCYDTNLRIVQGEVYVKDFGKSPARDPKHMIECIASVPGRGSVTFVDLQSAKDFVESLIR